MHMPMNMASRGLSGHSKRPHFSRCVSTGNALRSIKREGSNDDVEYIFVMRSLCLIDYIIQVLDQGRVACRHCVPIRFTLHTAVDLDW